MSRVEDLLRRSQVYPNKIEFCWISREPCERSSFLAWRARADGTDRTDERKAAGSWRTQRLVVSWSSWDYSGLVRISKMTLAASATVSMGEPAGMMLSVLAMSGLAYWSIKLPSSP